MRMVEQEPTCIMQRRTSTKTAGLAAPSASLTGQIGQALPAQAAGSRSTATGPLSGRRILTFNWVIRVNQIEVTRTRNEGFDEHDRRSPENMKALREAFAAGWPGAPMTWALSWRALEGSRPNYQAARRLVREFHNQYGEDVTLIPAAYFANMYNSREQVNRDIHEALAKVSDLMSGGFRPKALVAGFLSAANQKYLAEQDNIHVFQGNIGSQFGIDNADGEGSISYPYYPSTEHFGKPAQGPKDFVDCLNLDGWAVDFISARRLSLGKCKMGKKENGYNSRFGVGPIETIGWCGPDVGLKHMLTCTAAHFDAGYQLNQWAWVTNCWEVWLVPQVKDLPVLTRWLEGIRTPWSNAQCLAQGEFGQLWRRRHPNNEHLNYRFVQRGTGFGCRDANLEIRWFINRKFRLALPRDWEKSSPETVIDFARYDLPAKEPQDLSHNWGLLGRINQKQTRPQDRPCPLTALPEDDRALIRSLLPELGT